MPLVVILGAQWGDEGKGKVVDLYAEHADVVARFGGGANAGHTLWVNGKKYVTHLIPSGIVRGRPCLLGNGMVIDPRVLWQEMQDFIQQGLAVSPQNLIISSGAHIVTPAHIHLDEITAKAKLGTTGRGIGPAYEAKAARRGLRAGLMRDPKAFRQAVFDHSIESMVRNYRVGSKESFALVYREWEREADAIADEYAAYAERLAPHVQDTGDILHRYLEGGKTVIAEGAQGALIDIDHGTYPYVTSSTTTIGGVFSGLGIGPRHLQKIVGVVKAFQTRVGNGPMPTELFGDKAAWLRGVKGEPGSEYGATTGRDRRCGWLDLVALRYAIRVNSINELVLTKLDVLSGLDNIKICTAHEYNGRPYADVPDGAEDWDKYKPVYEDVRGWDGKIDKARHFFDLPAGARFYVRRIECLTGVKVAVISVGPERDQTFEV